MNESWANQGRDMPRLAPDVGNPATEGKAPIAPEIIALYGGLGLNRRQLPGITAPALLVSPESRTGMPPLDSHGVQLILFFRGCFSFQLAERLSC